MKLLGFRMQYEGTNWARDGWVTGWSWLAGCLKQMGTPLMCGLLPGGDGDEAAMDRGLLFSDTASVRRQISTSQAAFHASTICNPRGFVRRAPST